MGNDPITLVLNTPNHHVALIMITTPLALNWDHKSGVQGSIPYTPANLPNSIPSLYQGLPYCSTTSFIYEVFVHSSIIFPMWLLFFFCLLLLVIYQIP